MIISTSEAPPAESMRGTYGFGRGYGACVYGKARYAASCDQAGIYQRKVHGLGSTLMPRQEAGRYAISRMKFYRPTNNQQPQQQIWRGIFASGKAAYDTLSTDEKKTLREEASGGTMTGFNLFMSRFLQAHRA